MNTLRAENSVQIFQNLNIKRVTFNCSVVAFLLPTGQCHRAQNCWWVSPPSCRAVQQLSLCLTQCLAAALDLSANGPGVVMVSSRLTPDSSHWVSWKINADGYILLLLKSNLISLGVLYLHTQWSKEKERFWSLEVNQEQVLWAVTAGFVTCSSACGEIFGCDSNFWTIFNSSKY